MEPIEFLIRVGRTDTIDTLREYAARRLSFVIRRFERRVRRVTVRIADVNGPKRGVDSRCSMTVELNDGRQIFVNSLSAWPFTSIRQAASRLNEVLRRKGERTTTHRENPAPAGHLDIA